MPDKKGMLNIRRSQLNQNSFYLLKKVIVIQLVRLLKQKKNNMIKNEIGQIQDKDRDKKI